LEPCGAQLSVGAGAEELDAVADGDGGQLLKWEANGSRPDELIWPTAMYARFLMTVPAMALLGYWLG
jgi:hypothetical protein